MSGGHVWGVNSANDIYYRNGVNGNWRRIGGKLKHVSVSNDGKHIWGVNSNDHIYYRNGMNGNWRRIPGGLKQVDAMSGGHVWGVNSANDIYYRASARRLRHLQWDEHSSTDSMEDAPPVHQNDVMSDALQGGLEDTMPALAAWETDVMPDDDALATDLDLSSLMKQQLGLPDVSTSSAGEENLLAKSLERVSPQLECLKACGGGCTTTSGLGVLVMQSCQHLDQIQSCTRTLFPSGEPAKCLSTCTEQVVRLVRESVSMNTEQCNTIQRRANVLNGASKPQALKRASELQALSTTDFEDFSALEGAHANPIADWEDGRFSLYEFAAGKMANENNSGFDQGIWL